jgi:hypothetical protein
MKLSPLFPGKSAFLKGNFLILTPSWIIMYFAQPIPAIYASLYYLSLGADAFRLSVIGFAGLIAVALPIAGCGCCALVPAYSTQSLRTQR